MNDHMSPVLQRLNAILQVADDIEGNAQVMDTQVADVIENLADYVEDMMDCNDHEHIRLGLLHLALHLFAEISDHVATDILRDVVRMAREAECKEKLV